MAKQQKKIDKGIVLIKKSNNLVESRYRFDIWETRFFLSFLSKIRLDEPKVNTYRIWYSDLIKTYDLKSGDAYASLRKAAKSLIRKPVRINYEVDGVKREQEHILISTINYSLDGQGRAENHEYIDVTIVEEMKPFLLQLQKNFTAYDLQYVVKLGVYSVRVYELLKQYQGIGWRTLGIDEIRTMFELENEYQQFNDFNRSIIKTSEAEINQYTDLMVTDIEKLKQGRQIVALKFHFRRKTDAELRKIRHIKVEKSDPNTVVEEAEFEDMTENNPPLTTFNNAFPSQMTEQEPKPIATIPQNVAWTNHNVPPETWRQDTALPLHHQNTEGGETNENWVVELIPVVVTQFGVSLKMLMNLAENHSENDLRRAIVLTQKVLQAGRITNAAGFFVEAVRGNYQDKEEQKQTFEAQQAAERRAKMEAAQQAEMREKEAREAYHRNESVRKMKIMEELIAQNASVMQQALEWYLNSFFGSNYDTTKSLSENIQHPMIAGGMMNALTRVDPNIFRI